MSDLLSLKLFPGDWNTPPIVGSKWGRQNIPCLSDCLSVSRTVFRVEYVSPDGTFVGITHLSNNPGVVIHSASSTPVMVEKDTRFVAYVGTRYQFKHDWAGVYIEVMHPTLGNHEKPPAIEQPAPPPCLDHIPDGYYEKDERYMETKEDDDVERNEVEEEDDQDKLVFADQNSEVDVSSEEEELTRVHVMPENFDNMTQIYRNFKSSRVEKKVFSPSHELDRSSAFRPVPLLQRLCLEKQEKVDRMKREFDMADRLHPSAAHWNAYRAILHGNIGGQPETALQKSDSHCKKRRSILPLVVRGEVAEEGRNP